MQMRGHVIHRTITIVCIFIGRSQ